MKFLIRDDDTCGFTRPEELVRCYEGIWDRIPVALSVTPFRVPGKQATTPDSPWPGDEPLPLDYNPELVTFLKESLAARRVEITLHGFEHTRPGGQPEYVGGSGLMDKTRRGKAYLEEVLGCRIDTFVPPFNGIAREGLEAVVAAGMNLVAMPSLLRGEFRPFRPGNIPKYLRIKYHQAVHRRKYPYVLDFGDHKEVSYHSITPTQDLEGLLEAFVQCQKADGVFVAAIHYHAFDARLKSGQTLRQALELLIQRAETVPGIEYPTFRDLWNS